MCASCFWLSLSRFFFLVNLLIANFSVCYRLPGEKRYFSRSFLFVCFVFLTFSFCLLNAGSVYEVRPPVARKRATCSSNCLGSDQDRQLSQPKKNLACFFVFADAQHT